MNPSRILPGMSCIAVALVAACGTEPSNSPPIAAFTADCQQLECVFENTSTDQDGTIADHVWDFGDGVTSTESSPIHSYATPGGEFTVTVAVIDNDGAVASTSRQVTVSQGDDGPPADDDNLAPAAAFSVRCWGLACWFTDKSTDEDGTITGYVWDFGDGVTSTASTPTHIYAGQGGTFTVTMVVIDNRGASASTARPVLAGREILPNINGTYERETPHSSSSLHSRYEFRQDGTFDYSEESSSGQRSFSGRWTFRADLWGGFDASGAILLEFDDFGLPYEFCPEGIGSFLLAGHLAISYCQDPIAAGLEEGVYTNAPNREIEEAPPPQGGQIAFVRDGKIYRVNADGTGLMQLSSGPADNDPAWSPDGSRIAFTRGGDAAGVYIMSGDGASQVRRTTSGGSPTWSPDGEWVAFSCREDVLNSICKVKAVDDGSSRKEVYNSPGFVTHPAWSPDGTRIAFSSDRNQFDFFTEIWVVSADGSQATSLSRLESWGDWQYQPAWSPDGQRIALIECPWAWYICRSSAIAVMNADGSSRLRLAVASGFAGPTWSPDGQTIAFASGNSIEWVSADGRHRGRIIANGTSPAWRP